MNGIYNPIVFYPAAILLIGLALLTIYFRNIFYSLLCSICVFLLTAYFFYILGSEYNAIIQFAIYGVAIPIILGIAVMFTEHKNKPKSQKNTEQNCSWLNYFTTISGVLFILGFVYLILTSITLVPNSFHISSKIQALSTLQNIQIFSNGMFIDYIIAFELVSLLLTIAVVGIAIITPKRRSK